MEDKRKKRAMKKKSLIILFAVIIGLMIFPILWQIQIVKDYKYEYEWRNEAYEQVPFSLHYQII